MLLSWQGGACMWSQQTTPTLKPVMILISLRVTIEGTSWNIAGHHSPIWKNWKSSRGRLGEHKILNRTYKQLIDTEISDVNHLTPKIHWEILPSNFITFLFNLDMRIWCHIKINLVADMLYYSHKLFTKWCFEVIRSYMFITYWILNLIGSYECNSDINFLTDSNITVN